MKVEIAEQYQNIKPLFAEGQITPLAFRWRCILLDQDTEYPPFEPCRFFVVNVFAETRDQVIDCVAEHYPWCDIMVADKALGVAPDNDYLNCWLNYYDNTNQTPIKEAPHKKKTFTVWEQCTATNRYTVRAESEQEARELVANAQIDPRVLLHPKTDYSDYEITEVLEGTDEKR